MNFLRVKIISLILWQKSQILINLGKKIMKDSICICIRFIKNVFHLIYWKKSINLDRGG